MVDCPYSRRRWRKRPCRFEGRYHTSTTSQPISVEQIEAIGDHIYDDDRLEAIKTMVVGSEVETYVYDICVRCGQVVQRPEGETK